VPYHPHIKGWYLMFHPSFNRGRSKAHQPALEPVRACQYASSNFTGGQHWPFNCESDKPSPSLLGFKLADKGWEAIVVSV
jgi:hypothetical protein